MVRPKLAKYPANDWSLDRVTSSGGARKHLRFGATTIRSGVDGTDSTSLVFPRAGADADEALGESLSIVSVAEWHLAFKSPLFE